MVVILKVLFLNTCHDISPRVLLKLISCECIRIPLMDIGFGNGLVPSDNMSLPQPVLTQIYVAEAELSAVNGPDAIQRSMIF